MHLLVGQRLAHPRQGQVVAGAGRDLVVGVQAAHPVGRGAGVARGLAHLHHPHRRPDPLDGVAQRHQHPHLQAPLLHALAHHRQALRAQAAVRRRQVAGQPGPAGPDQRGEVVEVGVRVEHERRLAQRAHVGAAAAGGQRVEGGAAALDHPLEPGEVLGEVEPVPDVVLLHEAQVGLGGGAEVVVQPGRAALLAARAEQEDRTVLVGVLVAGGLHQIAVRWKPWNEREGVGPRWPW